MAQPLAQATPDVVLQSIFRFYDKDGSGSLDKNEFHKYLQSVGLANDDLEAQALKALTDDDADGQISFEEFKNFVKTDNAQQIVKTCESFEFLCTIYELFQKYDKDDDGSITYDEWKKEFIDVGRTEQEAKQMFEQTDTNKNGKITFDEFWHAING